MFVLLYIMRSVKERSGVSQLCIEREREREHDIRVKTTRRDLIVTRHEALLILLLSDRATFTDKQIDEKTRGIRRFLTDSKVAKWRQVYGPLRIAAEAIMATIKA